MVVSAIASTPHDSFPVMNDFPLLRTFHQDFRSHEEVNVDISIVSHGFNVVPLFWREHRKLPRFDKDHLIRLCTVFISVAEIFDRPMHNGKAWVTPLARSFIKMTFELFRQAQFVYSRKALSAYEYNSVGFAASFSLLR